jgi:predicted nucleic acid-binding protein
VIVVDTNVVAYLFLNGEHSDLSERLLTADPDWAVPRLWRSEFRNVLALYLRKGILPLDEVLSTLDKAERLLANGEYEVPSALVMQLVIASECSAYDCEFVALAQYLGVPLATQDRLLLRSFPETAHTIAACLPG